MLKLSFSLGRLVARTHLMFGLFLSFVVVFVMGTQIAFRRDFANTELKDEVLDRWGTPIWQPEPSVRFAEQGAVFTKLDALPFSRQKVGITSEMNYRRRGLVYFSGFDFRFDGTFAVTNDRPTPINLVFVFPLDMERARVLLSDLHFTVNGIEERIALEEGDDKLVWTGRAQPGEEVEFVITYAGRGLDSFTYVLDPALPVRNLEVVLDVTGGETFNYAMGVVPATEVVTRDGGVTLRWVYDSLEAGVPMGALLPSEKRYDEILQTMIVRSPIPFLGFFAGVVGLGIVHRRRLKVHETILVVSTYLFFYVLLPYLTAFMPFALAYVLSLGVVTALLSIYLGVVLGRSARRPTAMLLGAFLFTPTLAVILTGFTGLVYTLEILGALVALMIATTRPGFRVLAQGLSDLARPLPEPIVEGASS